MLRALPASLFAVLLASCATTQTPGPAPESERAVQVAAVTTPPPKHSPSLAPREPLTHETDDEDADKDPSEDDDEPESALGSLIGDEIGEAFGYGGLGLIGTASGDADGGVGLGSIGTIGRGSGTGTGSGLGSGSGRLGSSRDGGPSVASGPATAQGRLPPELIRRIVHQNMARIKYCYERRLTQNPNLAGKLSVRFIIGRNGAVSSVSNASSDIPDPDVISCVLNAFRSMSFPQPDGGIVVVTYPLVFRSVENATAGADAGAAPDAGR